MNVLALIEQPGNVCCRYRIDAYSPELTKRGHRLQTISLREGGRLRFLFAHSVRVCKPLGVFRSVFISREGSVEKCVKTRPAPSATALP